MTFDRVDMFLFEDLEKQETWNTILSVMQDVTLPMLKLKQNNNNTL